MTSITNLATTPQNITKDHFSKLSEAALAKIDLIVPASALEAYKAHEVWKLFKLPDAAPGGVNLQLSAKISPSSAFGSVEGVGLYNAATTVTLKAYPAAGCMFAGWTDEAGASLGSDYTLSFKINKDRIITANFYTTYTLTFSYSYSGVANTTQSVVSNKAALQPVAPTRTGYTFGGWYKEAECTNAWSFNTAVTANTTLYAKWAINTYAVTFNSQSGSAVSAQNINHGSKATAPAAPLRAGYTFGGWYKEAACTSAWDFNAAVTAATTLYAKWTPNTYRITFNSRGGGALDTGYIDVKFGAEVGLLANVSREGHTFTGWYDGPDANATKYEVTTKYTTAGDLDLFAQWAVNHYDVDFDSHGGSAVTSQRAVYDQKITLPVEPTKTGCTFEGWYCEPTYVTPWQFDVDVVKNSLTLHAKWLSSSCFVGFDESGGSRVSSVEVVYDGLVPPPAEPNRIGYLFAGWYREAACIHAWDFGIHRVSGDITLYARWQPTCTVSFDAMGGSAVAPQTVGVGSLIPKPLDPTRAGYAFAGWYVDESYRTPWSFSSTRNGLVQGNMTLYARWTEAGATMYTVRFSSRGGSLTDDQQVEAGQLAVAPSNPVKADSAFAGWYADEQLTQPWSFSGNAVTGDVVLYAKWAGKIYFTVAFDSNQGSPVDTQKVERGGLVVKPANPMRTDYIFAGWYVDASFNEPWIFSAKKITANTRIYAKWLDVQADRFYTVTFATYGGSSVDRQMVRENDIVRNPGAPTRTGYVFNGWYAEDDFVNRWDFAARVTGRLTLHAKWQKDTCTVYFDSRGGSGSDALRKVAYGDTVSRPANPVKAGGYAFGGWYADTLFTSPWSFLTGVITSNDTLYARWIAPNKAAFTVSFSTYGGGLIDPQQVDSGSLAMQPLTPKRAGHTFIGWYTVPNADPSVDRRWRFADDTVKDNMTLHAKWEVKQYPVIFETGADGSPVSGSGALVPYGGKVERPSNPTRPNYTFGGWYAEPESKTFWSFALDVVTNTTTLYARWISASTPLYTVFFATGGGGSSVVEPQLVGAGDLVAMPATPTRPSYIFGGWYADEGCTALWNFSTGAVRSEMTLYARWWSTDAQASLLVFNPSGGTVSPLTHEVTYGREVGLLPTPERSGHHFGGWFDGSGTPYGESTVYLNEGNTTLIAQWTVKSYAVRFNPRGGSSVAGQSIAYGDSVRMPVRPVKTGCRFDGWLRDTTPASPKLWSFEKDKITRDTTLYAKWTVERYAIRYVSSVAGMSNPNPATYTVEDNIALQHASKAGYTFGGWYDAEQGGNPVASIPKNSATGDKTLYARWTPITYTFIFNGQGGSSPTPASRNYPYGDTLKTLAATSRMGYHFAGWHTGESCAGRRYGETSVYDTVPSMGTSVTLYACWEVNRYAVAFSANGGSRVDAQQVAYNDFAVEPQPAPTRDGYTFAGWYQNSDFSGSAWDFASGAVAQPLTLHAKWTPVAYSITYHDADGATHANPPTYAVEDELLLQPAAKTGYTFAGWHNQSAGGRQLTYIPLGSTGDREFWARWQPITYTIGFDGSGGTVSRAFQNVVFHSRVDSLPQPEHTGFVFDGWYTQPVSGGARYTADSVYREAKHITLYARWKIATYTVTFEDNGANVPIPPQVDLAYGRTVLRPADPVKANHKFGGWYKDAALTTQWNFSTDVVNGNVTLYAWWIDKNTITYKVAFNTDGGSIIDTQTVRLDGYVIKPKDPTKVNYIFDKWYKDENYNHPWLFSTDMVTSNVTLHAGWVLKAYNLIFDGNEGKVDPLSKPVYYGERVGELPVPTRTGYDFLGWYTANSQKRYVDTTMYDVTSDTYLHAGWQPKTYTVTFSTKGGVSIAPKKATHNSSVDKPVPSPSRSGYSFIDWYRDENLSQLWSFEFYKVTQDTTLYAKWQIVKYGVTYRDVAATEHSNPDTFTVESDIVLHEATRTGYVFEGWYGSAQKGGDRVRAILKGSTKNKELWASWLPITYTISFDARGGQVSRPSQPAVFKTNIDSLPAPALEGHSFDGWYALPNGGGQKYETFTPYSSATNITLYAKWSVKTSYKVTLKYNIAGTADGKLENITYNALIASEPGHFSKQGYEFLGWYDDTTALAPWSFAKGRVTRDTILWARWKPAVYSIAYHNVEGVAHGNPTTYTIESSGIPLQAVSRGGYKFVGWSSDALGSTPTTGIPPQSTGNKEFWAQWKKIHTVTFEAGGGSPVPPSCYIANGDAVSKPAAPSRKGYDFKEWFADGGTFRRLWNFATGSVTQDTTLYAKWEGKTYQVTFAGNEGVVPDDDVTKFATYGSPIGKLPKANRAGYDLIGWSIAKSGTGKWYADTTIYDTANITTLYAQWRLKRYAVAFVSENALWRDAVVNHNTAVSKPATPQKAGYELLHWCSDTVGWTEWHFSTKVTQDTTLYAKWRIKNYSVTFESNGGSEVKDTTVAHNGTIRRPTDPFKLRRLFAGWYSDGEPYERPWDFSNVVTQPVTLYARWLESGVNMFLLAFDAAGGSSSILCKEVAHLSKVGLLPTPTLLGYTFNGWFTAPDGAGQRYDADTVYNKTENLTLYASWTVNPYAVTLNANSGTLSGGATVDAYYGKPLGVLPEASREGYTFAGWNDAADGGGKTYAAHSVFDLLTPLTLYAQWSPSSYRVTFDSRGGSSVPPQRVQYGAHAAQPSDPSCNGYTFAGWRKGAESGAPAWSFTGDAVVRDTTLYAAWDTLRYSVTFNSAGGSTVGGGTPVAVAHSGLVAKPADPTRASFAFGGWYADNAYERPWDFASSRVTGNVTLYAKWWAASGSGSTLIFDAKGGVASPVSKDVALNSKVGDLPTPTRAGYDFSGWNDRTDGAGKSYAKDTVYRATANTTLYAQWSARQCSVVFIISGSVAHREAVPYGSFVPQPADPQRSGYTFGGWHSDKAFRFAWSFGEDRVTQTDTLYAKWVANVYAITYANAAGAQHGNPASYTVEDNAIALSAATRAGCNFSGWWSAPAGGEKVSAIPATSARDTTLYARWDTLRFTVTFNSAGGSTVGGGTPVAVAYNGLVAKPADPTKPSFAFGGWYTDNGTFANPWNFAANRVTGNVVLFARWWQTGGSTYTLVFDGNGGSVHPDSVTKSANHLAKVGVLPTPARAGYTFSGWNAKQDGSGAKYTKDSTYRSAEPITLLYAQWTVNSYGVTYRNVAGATHGNPASYTVESGTLTLLKAEKAGYTFTGWYGDSTASPTPVTAITPATSAGVTLWARWEKVHTVTFNPNGGGLSTPSGLAVADGKTVAKPADPARTGYTFNGWYGDAGLATPWDFGSAVTGDVTLHAKWDVKIYTVTFSTDGGSAIPPRATPHEHAICPPPQDPTRNGFAFKGWYRDAAHTIPWSISADVVTDNLTLYAKWESVANVSLKSVTVNGKALAKKFDDDSTTYYYEVPCDAFMDSLRIHLDVPVGVESSFPDDTALLVGRAGRHSYPVTLSVSGERPRRYNLVLERPFVFDSIVHVQLGGKLLMVIKNPKHNGEYHLQNAWWYRNSERVGEKFYYVPPTALSPYDTVFVMLQDTAGAWITSCPLTLDSASALVGKLKGVQVAVYPNPVPAGGVVHLKAENPSNGTLEELFESVAVLDVQGRRVYVGKTADLRHGLPMPTIPGVYFIVLDGPSGAVKIKVSVGQ